MELEPTVVSEGVQASTASCFTRADHQQQGGRGEQPLHSRQMDHAPGPDPEFAWPMHRDALSPSGLYATRGTAARCCIAVITRPGLGESNGLCARNGKIKRVIYQE
jgi:hypothetical protein